MVALKDLVCRELPRLDERARQVGMPLELKMTRWLLVNFVNCFPGSVALRILEVSTAWHGRLAICLLISSLKR